MAYNRRMRKVLSQLKAGILIVFGLLLVSCTNLADEVAAEIEEAESKEISYGINATLSVSDELLGIPDSVNTAIQSSDSARTAMPVLPTGRYYYVEWGATSTWANTSTHTVKNSNVAANSGFFNGTGTSITGFFIPLSNGSWTVETGLKDGTTNAKIITASDAFTLSPTSSVYNHTFNLMMSQSGTGDVELKIEGASGTNISDIVMVLQKTGDTAITATRSGTTYSASNIPSGEYTATINCYNSDSTPVVLYSDTQLINVYDNMTTNRWIINGGEMQETLTITAQDVADFAVHQFYVDSVNGSSTNNGKTVNKPLDKISSAITAVNSQPGNGTFTIHVKGGSSETCSNSISILKNIKIECYNTVPGDRAGTATLNTPVGSSAKAIEIGNSSTAAKLILDSSTDDGLTGLVIDGNDNCSNGILLTKGEFVMNGGKITRHKLAVETDLSTLFKMSGGEISNNDCEKNTPYQSASALKCYGTFEMTGGKIINNIVYAGYPAINMSGTMKVGGTKIQIKNNVTQTSPAQQENLVIYADSNDPPGLCPIIVTAPLYQDTTHKSEIWLHTEFRTNPAATGLPLPPTITTPVPFTSGCTEAVPSRVFRDDRGTYAIVKMNTGTEAAFGMSGGEINYTALDFDFDFAVTSQMAEPNQAKTITVTPTITRTAGTPAVTTTFYWNASGDQRLYLSESEASGTDAYQNAIGYNSSAADPENDATNKLTLTATLYAGGAPVSASYQPSPVSGSANQFSIPGISYPYNYTLKVTATYLGVSHDKEFNFSVINPNVAVPTASTTGTAGSVISNVFVANRNLTIPSIIACDHEVTQREYEKYCLYMSSPIEQYGLGPDYPAYYIDWYDAIVYCNLRTIDEMGLDNCVYEFTGYGKNPSGWPGKRENTVGGVTKYGGPLFTNVEWDANITCDMTKTGWRLPTNAEWEYLARGGNLTSTNQKVYSGSNNLADVGWYQSNCTKIHPVKEKQPNALGLYDMSGNLEEWCWDWDGTITSTTGILGPGSGMFRVYRGGSWDGEATNLDFIGCTSAYGGSYRIGIRVVRTAD